MRAGRQDRSAPRQPAATAPRGVHALTVAATVLALLTITGGALVVLRLPRRSPAAVVDAGAAGMPGESQGAPLRAPARASRAGAVGIPSHTTIDRPSRVTSEVTAILKRNRLVLEHRQQLLEQADEWAFQSLQLPEPLCVLVRRVNDEWAEKRRALSNAPVGGQTPEQAMAGAEAGNAELDRTRRVALANVLGWAKLQELDAAEGAALSRLRERFRGWEDRVGGTARPTIDLAAQ